MEEEKPNSVRNKKWLVQEDEQQNVVREDEERELPVETTENVLEKEKALNELLADIKNINLRIEQINLLQFVLQNFKNVKKFQSDSGSNNDSSENEEEFKKKKEKKSAEKSDLSVTEPEVKPNLCKTNDDINFAADIEIKHVVSEIKEEMTCSKDICLMEEKVEEGLNKVQIDLPKRIRFVGSKAHSHKKIAKRKSRGVPKIVQKKSRKENCLNETDQIENEKGDEELEFIDYVEHDKKYFFVHSAEISCKLCSFKGKLIVQHYRMKHPESEVLISRIDPDITKILIEDAKRNREEYDKNHPKLRTKCNLKCPFCLTTIKNTLNGYYNHVSSHTGEYHFRCDHCSYWTYNSIKVRAHLNQMHYKIPKRGYKRVNPDPKISKYVFGYICSKCNFIQLTRATVEEHAMVYHPGTPVIYRVNLGVLIHEDAVDKNHMNEIHSNENRPNHNLKISAKIKELSKILEDDPCPTKLATFICQTNMDIKQDSENYKAEILQWTDENAEKARTSTSDKLQAKLVIEPIKESEKIQADVLASIPLVTKNKMITSVQSVASKTKQLNLVSENHSKCTSVLIDVQMTDSIKQNEKCPKTPSIFYKCPKYDFNFNELVPPYNCKDDGFPNCPFKTLYFDEYLKHVEAVHQIDGFSSFSPADEPLRTAIMDGWLAKEVGPFQCRYCKKATVTHQEMGRHQAMLHTQSESWFYYRKFVPSDTVTTSEQVNVEDPSFINHVIHLPDQAHLCDFKLVDGLLFSTYAKLTNKASKSSQPLLPQLPSRDPEIDQEQSKILLDEPKILREPSDNEIDSFGESDSLCLDDESSVDSGTHDDELSEGEPSEHEPTKHKLSEDEPSQNHSAHNDSMLTDEALHKSTKRKVQCKWKRCYQTYHSQPALVKHIEKNHVKVQRCRKFTCFWINCPRKSKPYTTKRNLRIHMRLHTGEKPYKCLFQGCNAMYSQLIHLTRHQTRHMGEKPFSCGFLSCHKNFSSISEKMAHEKTHDNTNCYACRVPGCSKRYTDPARLRQHRKNHTVDDQLKEVDFVINTKPYVCPITGCSKRYGTRGGLRKHMTDHTVDQQPEVKRKPVKHQRTQYDTCQWEGCHETFHSEKTAFIKHVMNHVKSQKDKEFTCSWINCSRKSIPYRTKQDLLRHMMIHSGEKPHICLFQDCNTAFARLEHLKLHEMIHTGEKPYKCQFANCAKRFSSKCHRTRHQRTHVKPYACQVVNCSKRYAEQCSLQKHMENHIVDKQLEGEQKCDKNKQKESDFIIYQI